MPSRATGAALAACLACAAAPPSGPQRPRPEVILRTEAVDRRVGEEASAEVGGELGLVEDAELADYVERVGRRLVRYAPRRTFEYQFRVVDQDVPNAFALPGGFIYVSRGLLVLANSEDELAGVLAHEIIHVSARHAAARQSVVRNVPGPLRFFAIGSFASYSREQEREADRLGQGLAGLAGYDPAGMAKFLKELEYTERLRLGASRLPGFFDTHPATSERVASAGARAEIIAWQRRPAIAADRADYLRRIDGLVVGGAGAEGVFHGQRFLHPDLDFTLRFPDGWDTRNTRTAVGAISPTRDAMVYLEMQGQGDDPEAAAREYLKEILPEGFRLDRSEPVRVGAFPGHRITGRSGTPRGPVSVVLTWITREGRVYRLTGAALGSGGKREGSFLSVARSFRPLTPSLRASIRESRLRIASAREGETLAQLAERTGNQWDLQVTAVMNDVFANQPLAQGQLVKIAVLERYGSPTEAR